ncbi:hypothetical protein HYZ76_02410 [Candidatus Falkowbacteria bacterium]|nr:hypothetical protein [Candidatus Falkowbacteria bacterium]
MEEFKNRKGSTMFKKFSPYLLMALVPVAFLTVLSSCPPVDPGPPNIWFTAVPAYGSFDNLAGKVSGVDGDTHYGVVYIKVSDVWWTKPYYASPLTPIRSNGTWSCDITTGGDDRYATQIAAFLIPAGIDPPICGPCTQLPVIPEALDSVSFDRTPPVSMLDFAGYEWAVKRSDYPVGPGPNYFSDENQSIWVDSDGLHLTIRQSNGRWECTEAILEQSFGYGTYISQTSGRVDVLNKDIVFGGFLWDVNASNIHYREIDFFEFTRWGNPAEETNAQNVLHPCAVCPGCGNCQRFRIDLTDQDTALTSYMIWQPGFLEFRTYYGHHYDQPPYEMLAHEWTITGSEVPEPGTENVRFNLWLNAANSPSDNQPTEVIIKDFIWLAGSLEWPKPPEPPVPPTTNLPVYPVLGYAEGAEQVLINGVEANLDAYFGYRYDATLQEGLNLFEIETVSQGKVVIDGAIQVIYEP